MVIIGAGISGINCAYRLQTQLPHLRFAILEARGDIGGTWDLFRYPGIRSDSDLHTFGFSWHPWPHEHPIAEGPLIVSYMKECVSTYSLDRYINLRHKVLSADWSSKSNKWSLRVESEGQTKYYRTTFVVLGAGYYDYEQPMKTEIPGIANFKGDTIHPQFWPEDYDYTDKKMVIVGSGATAVTLLPNLTKKAAHVTMLQRSPSYIVSTRQSWPLPAIIPRKRWPRSLLSFLERTWFIIVPTFFTEMCRWFPKLMKSMLQKQTLKLLPPRLSYDPHFNPRYYPWQQRVCMAPDGDFYKALHTPRADVVTSHIKTVVEDGIELTNGQKLEADVIITATGIRLRFGGGIPLRVDGEPMDLPQKILWNGSMIQDVPNLFFMIGYTNASWTMGADDTAFIICRLLSYMAQRRIHTAVPRMPREEVVERRSSWDLSSTYSNEGQVRLPKYGNKGPWRPRNHVIKDYAHARLGNITDGLHFTS